MDDLFSFLEQGVVSPCGLEQRQDLGPLLDEIVEIKNSSSPLEPQFDQSEQSAGDNGLLDYLQLSPAKLETFLHQTKGLHEEPPELEKYVFPDDNDDGMDEAARQIDFLLGEVRGRPEFVNEYEQELQTQDENRTRDKVNKIRGKLLDKVDIRGETSPSWALNVADQPETQAKAEEVPKSPSETTCHDYFHSPRVPSPRKQRKASSPAAQNQERDSPSVPLITADQRLEPATPTIQRDTGAVFKQPDVGSHPLNPDNRDKAAVFKKLEVPAPRKEVENRAPKTEDSTEDVPKTFYCRELSRELSLFNFYHFPPQTQALILQQMEAGLQAIELLDPNYRPDPPSSTARTSTPGAVVRQPAEDGASLLQEAAPAAGLLDSGSEAEPSLHPQSPRRSPGRRSPSGKGRNDMQSGFNRDPLLSQLSSQQEPTNNRGTENSLLECDNPLEAAVAQYANPTPQQSPEPSSPERKDPNGFDPLSFMNDLMNTENQERKENMGIPEHLDILADLNQEPADDGFASAVGASAPTSKVSAAESPVRSKVTSSVPPSQPEDKVQLSSKDKPLYPTDVFPGMDEEGLGDERYLDFMSETTCTNNIPGYEPSMEDDDFMNQYFQESLPKRPRIEESVEQRPEEPTLADFEFSETSKVAQSPEVNQTAEAPLSSVDQSLLSGVHSANYGPTSEDIDDVVFSEAKLLESEDFIPGELEGDDLGLQGREVTPLNSPKAPADDPFDEINKFLSSLN